MDLRHKLFRIVRHSLIYQRDLSGKSIEFQISKKPPIVVGGFFMTSAKTDNRADSRWNPCNFSNL